MVERRYFKKARLDVIILKKESDATGQYEVFQRLNTGGTSLTSQEVRNCLMVMTDANKFRIVKDLSEYENFKKCLNINDKSYQERFDMELVTRFICMRHENIDRYSNVRDFSDYLNDKIVSIFRDENFNWEDEINVFKRTFDSIAQVLGDDAFCKYDMNKAQFKGGFYIPAFEFVAISIGLHNGQVDDRTLRERVINIWKEISKRSISWQGRNHRVRIKETIDLGNMLYEQN